MSSQLKRALPGVALAGALVLVISVGLLSYFRRPLVTDMGETRPAVEATLAKLQALHPTALDAPAFRSAVGQTVRAPHVVTVWLIAPDGRFVYAAGATAQSAPAGRSAEQLAGPDTIGLLSTLPDDILSAEQRVILLSAAAIRREGEHNDLFRHMLRPVRDPDGRLVALVAAAYKASTSGVGAVFVIAVLAGPAGLGLYWLSLVLWVFLDARQHADRAYVWALFVFIGNLVALIAYLLARPPRQAS